MMRYVLLALVIAVIAVVAFYVGVNSLGVWEGKVVDELGELHEVVIGGPFVVIKHDPGAYQKDGDFGKMKRYIEARRASWERWRKLVEKYGNEVFDAYVVPCRLLTYEEFPSFVKNLGLAEEITGIVSYTYINGTYELLGHGIRHSSDVDLDEWVRNVYEKHLLSVGHYVLSLKRRSINGSAASFNMTDFDVSKAIEVGRSVADVYVGAFTIRAPLKELYNLSKRPEILMVDTPLDLIWRYREAGKIVIVKRVAFGDKYLIEKKNLC